MIRHVVLFQFKEGISQEGLAAWQAGLDGMKGKIPGMLSLEHGADVMEKERSFDYAVVGDFETLEDIDVYDNHPLHITLKEFSLPNSEKIHSVDFVVFDEAERGVL